MGAQDSIREVVRVDAAAVAAGDSLRTAISAMVANGVSALTVKSGNELIGILTDMDIMLCINSGKDLDSTKVMTSMTACELITSKGAKSPCVQLDEDESVEMALKIMAEAGVHNLLVTGDADRPVGMVSSRDLLSQMLV